MVVETERLGASHTGIRLNASKVTLEEEGRIKGEEKQTGMHANRRKKV